MVVLAYWGNQPHLTISLIDYVVCSHTDFLHSQSHSTIISLYRHSPVLGFICLSLKFSSYKNIRPRERVAGAGTGGQFKTEITLKVKCLVAAPGYQAAPLSHHPPTIRSEVPSLEPRWPWSGGLMVELSLTSSCQSDSLFVVTGHSWVAWPGLTGNTNTTQAQLGPRMLSLGTCPPFLLTTTESWARTQD